MYILNHQRHIYGYGKMRRCMFTHEDINEVKKKLCEVVRNGLPVSELSITKEIPFELKCAVAINDADLEKV